MNMQEKDIKVLLHECLQKTDPQERNAFLDTACGDNLALRQRMNQLLQAYDQADDFLEIPLFPGHLNNDDCIDEGPGTVIGHYKLLERIGKGGMAVVYMAQQERPVRRQVALKIIKLGMDTREVIARFEAERQALAMMDHPNIAKVFDAGATESGRPYFVMELVRGTTITEYCDQNNLNTEERLHLFILVCNAVQHAHQKGIIHRDIKPTNVMVTLHDGKPVPKIIDFGIAKAIHQRLTEKTLFTRYAQMIGTPEYMSPEQAEMSGLDIDTRTDIYSLGVLLYQLLTGVTPFDATTLREVGYAEIQRIIREEEPTKPSTKLSTLHKSLDDIAKHRRTTPDSLQKAIRGDLDWIVMKTLEKDRIRRYETAHALAMDVQYHLQHEPIQARPYSLTYRVTKFLRKHQLQVAAGFTLAFLISGIIILSILWSQKRKQWLETEYIRHRNLLTQARESFTKREFAETLELVEPLLDSKHVGPEACLLHANLLLEGNHTEAAKSELETLLAQPPEIAGTAHSLLARFYWNSELDYTAKMEEVHYHQQQAETLLPQTAEAYYLRALTALTIKEKMDMLNRALRENPGHYDSLMLRAYTNYASQKYEEVLEDARVMVALRRQDPQGHLLLGMARREQRDYQRAIEDLNQAIALLPEQDPQIVEFYDQRRQTYMQMGKYQEALRDAQYCVSLAPHEKYYHIHVFTTLMASGQYEKAKDEFSKSLTLDNAFWNRSAKFLFDTLQSGHELSLPPSASTEAAFLPLWEAHNIYMELIQKARRIINGGWHANWSPDGTKLAFSMGVHGNSGVGIYNLQTQETELLIVPGKDALFSPDSQYIAFVRDRQILSLKKLAFDKKYQPQAEQQEELWIMKADGTEPRRVGKGKWPQWSQDSQTLWFQSVIDRQYYSIQINRKNATPVVVADEPKFLRYLTPDRKYIADFAGNTVRIFESPSKTQVAQWTGPPPIRMGSWAPKSRRAFFSSQPSTWAEMGYWLYNVDQNEACKVLCPPRTGYISWSPDERQLAFCMGSPYYETWIVDIEALGPGKTLAQHNQEVADFYNRLSKIDPKGVAGYFLRSAFNPNLADPNNMYPDLEEFSDIIWGKPSDFGQPKNLGPRINSSTPEASSCLSRDGRELYITSGREGGQGDWDIWTSTWDGIKNEWTDLIHLEMPLNGQQTESTLCLSSDGLTLYFASDRAGGQGGYDLWMTTRKTQTDSWGQPLNLGPPVNSTAEERFPHITSEGTELYFSEGWTSNRPGGKGGSDIWVAKRPTKEDPWGIPVNVGTGVNTSFYEGGSFLSQDGLRLFFHSNRILGRTSEVFGLEIWVATRLDMHTPFGQASLLPPPVNSFYKDASVHLSADQSILYFSSTRPGGSGGFDLWQVPILKLPGD